MQKNIFLNRGFTLVETLVAISIFVIVVGVAISIFSNTLAGNRKAEANRELFEESRVLMERVVKEIRRGTIDYEEYWNQYREGEGDYGKNYGEYAAKFYEKNSNINLDLSDVDRSAENIGENTSGEHPIDVPGSSGYLRCDDKPFSSESANEQCELYLISSDGWEKTILRVADYNSVPLTSLPVSYGGGREEQFRLEILRLEGEDLDGDGVPDEFNPLPDFHDPDGDQVFRSIQPSEIKIKDFKFIISPLEDPRKSFADFSNEIQIQPHVTIQITVEPTIKKAIGLRGEAPEVTIQTTVSARAQNEVKSL